MAYNEKLASRVRQALRGHKGLMEKKMFGGIAFMLGGHMCCGVVGEELVVRVGPHRYEETLARPHTRPMDFTGRPIKGFIYVGPGGSQTDESLEGWVQRGVEFVLSLPPK